MQIQSNASLIQENQRLRAQIAELKSQKPSPVSIDPKAGVLDVTDFRTDQFTVNKLRVSSEGISDVASSLSKIDQWVKPGGAQGLSSLASSTQKKLTVNELELSVPFRTINETIPKVAGDKLKEVGLSELSLTKGSRPNEISLSGRVNRVVDVSFDAVGEVSLSRTGEPSFRLRSTSVAGIPMPNFLASLATQLFAGDAMRNVGVRQNGNDFTLNPSKLIPANVDGQLTGLRVTRDGFIIQGGPKT